MEEKGKEEAKSNDVTKTFEFKASLILLVIVLGVSFIHQLLGWVGISGNLVWFILNLAFSVIAGLEVAANAYFLTKVTLPNKDKDVASFVINLVALIFACLCLIWWLSDMGVNLRGVIKG